MPKFPAVPSLDTLFSSPEQYNSFLDWVMALGWVIVPIWIIAATGMRLVFGSREDRE